MLVHKQEVHKQQEEYDLRFHLYQEKEIGWSPDLGMRSTVLVSAKTHRILGRSAVSLLAGMVREVRSADEEGANNIRVPKSVL